MHKLLSLIGAAGLLAASAGCESPAATPPVSSRASRVDVYLTTQKISGPTDLPAADTINSPAIDGVFIRINWRALQPERYRYDWSMIDQIARQAVAAKKILSIGVIAGDQSPIWLQPEVPFTTVEIARKRACLTRSYPVVWSPAYIDKYLGMMAAIKKRLLFLGAYDSVRMIKITAIAQQTLELRLPRNNRCSNKVDAAWAAAGYRPSKIIAAWGQIADGLDKLYPGRILAQPILRVQGFPGINENGALVDRATQRTGDEIINLCLRRYAARCGVQWNALKLKGRMADRVTDAHERGATIGWQTNLYQGPRVGVGCQENKRAGRLPCSASDYENLIRRGINLGGTFIEVWEPDVRRFSDALIKAKTTH